MYHDTFAKTQYIIKITGKLDKGNLDWTGQMKHLYYFKATFYHK